MGLFDSYSTPVEQITTGFGLNPSSIPYAVVLTDVKKHTRQKDNRVSTILVFTADPSADQEHRKGKQDVFINKPVDGDKNADTTAGNAVRWVKDYLKIPLAVYGQPDFELWDVKDKLVGMRGYLLVTQNGEFTNYRFTKYVENTEQGNTGPSEVVVPEAKAEEPLDMAKLLAEQDTSSGSW